MQEEEGRFSSRVVVPGMESGDYVEIIAGVGPGEKVVTSGQFLIDSEASLNASLQRLGTAEDPGEDLGEDQGEDRGEGHGTHDMDMPEEEGQQ